MPCSGICAHILGYSGNRFLFALPCRSYPLGQKCITEKMSKFFLVIGIFVVGRTSLQVIIAGSSRKTGAEIKKLSTYPPAFSRFHVAHHRYCIHHKKWRFFNYFVCCNLLKKWDHDNAGNGIVLLANAISGIGWTKNERKIPQMKGKKRKYSQRQAQKKPDG